MDEQTERQESMGQAVEGGGLRSLQKYESMADSPQPTSPQVEDEGSPDISSEMSDNESLKLDLTEKELEKTTIPAKLSPTRPQSTTKKIPENNSERVPEINSQNLSKNSLIEKTLENSDEGRSASNPKKMGNSVRFHDHLKPISENQHENVTSDSLQIPAPTLFHGIEIERTKKRFSKAITGLDRLADFKNDPSFKNLLEPLDIEKINQKFDFAHNQKTLMEKIENANSNRRHSRLAQINQVIVASGKSSGSSNSKNSRNSKLNSAKNSVSKLDSKSSLNQVKMGQEKPLVGSQPKTDAPSVPNFFFKKGSKIQAPPANAEAKKMAESIHISEKGDFDEMSFLKSKLAEAEEEYRLVKDQIEQIDINILEMRTEIHKILARRKTKTEVVRGNHELLKNLSEIQTERQRKIQSVAAKTKAERDQILQDLTQKENIIKAQFRQEKHHRLERSILTIRERSRNRRLKTEQGDSTPPPA